MTSHHDVAGATSALRSERNLRRAWRLEVASLLESQAKALSEWKQAAGVEAGLRREFYDRALAAEARLAEVEAERDALTHDIKRHIEIASENEASRVEATKVIGFYADPRRYDGPNQRNDNSDPFSGDDPYIRDVTRDGGAIARAFTNAAKEKT